MQQRGSPFIEEVLHAVPSLSYFWIVLIEFFTVLKNQIHVDHKTIQSRVPVIQKINKTPVS